MMRRWLCDVVVVCECHHILTTELFLNIDQNQSMLLVMSLKKVLPEKGFSTFSLVLGYLRPFLWLSNHIVHTLTKILLKIKIIYSFDLQNELINSKGEFFIMMFLMSLLLLFLHIIVQCVGVGAGGLWELTVAAGWSAG